MEVFIHKLLSCINDYIEDMAMFTALVKIFANESKWQKFSPGKISNYTVHDIVHHYTCTVMHNNGGTAHHEYASGMMSSTTT